MKLSFAKFLGLIATVCLAASPVMAATPNTLLIEGVLLSSGGGAAADGKYALTFSIYNVQVGGSAAWTEGEATVVVQGGHFVHTLGNAKPLTPALFSQLAKAWLGIKIGADPEQPRQAMHAVAYAVLASAAAELACSGCIKTAHLATGSVSADRVAFAYAGSKTKGGPADIAIDLQCTGCVSVTELKIDQDLDLGGNALKAKAVSASTMSATTFQGDGSKLTGIKIPSGTCKVAGEVVKGINPDGTLQCVKALDPSALPPDGIDEISNFLIHNQFQNTDCIAKAVPIKDNNPIGAPAELTFGDYGLAQKLDVQITVNNSDMKTVTIKLWDPNNVEYLLWDKSGPGKTLAGVWPSKNKELKGDLSTWVNKNPKGKWRLQAIDGAFLNNGEDGAVVKFCVSIQTLSNKKIRVGGNLIVDGDETVGGTLSVTGKTTVKDLEVTGKITGAIAQYGSVFTYWGHDSCPTGAVKLYDGAGFGGHYTHAGSNTGVCVKKGDPGPSYGYEGDLLYPIHTSGSMPPGIPSNKSLYCAVCAWEKGQCFEMWGSDNCPTGFSKLYGGLSVGPHYTHQGPAGGRYCINPTGFKTSTGGSGNGHLYGTRVQSGHYGGNWPSGRALKCGLCCRG